MDLESRVTIVEERMADQQAFFRELAQTLRQFEARVDARFAAIDARFGDVDARLTGLDRKMDVQGLEMAALRRDMTMQLTTQFRWVVGITVTTLVGVFAGMSGIIAAVLTR